MKKKSFTKPFIRLTTAELNDIGAGSLPGGLDSVRPLPMSFDEWTMSRFCGDVDSSGGVDFADYASWWTANGFGEDGLLAYNPELAATEEVVDLQPEVVTDVLGEDIVGGSQLPVKQSKQSERIAWGVFSTLFFRSGGTPSVTALA